MTCAVSGGADSLALLVLARAARLAVTVVHVDHGLRPGSAAETELVAAAAERFGAGFVALQVEVEAGPNLEARARAARYGALPDGVLTGHTADDQAETVLLNLLRGSGLAGLAGMRAEATRPGGARLTRPLLALRRSDTEAVCTGAGLLPFADPSNADPRHRRNRIRHELLPLLDDIAERDVAGLLAREADVLRADHDLLDVLAAGIDPTDARALTAAPAPLARRAVRQWLTPALGGRPPDAATVERVLAVARTEVVACEVSGGARIERHGMRLSLTAPDRGQDGRPGSASVKGRPLR